jgi:ABC-type glycerol-3-phosphate transport system permease component
MIQSLLFFVISLTLTHEVAIIPPVILFVLTQRYFVEGITTTGLKG